MSKHHATTTSSNKNDEDDDNEEDDKDEETLICRVETPFVTLRILEDLSSDDHPDEQQDGEDNEDDNDDDDDDEGLEDSIGRFVWPTAVPLLRHMLQSSSSSSSSSDTGITHGWWQSSSLLMVELGAGCGVLGMGMAAAVAANHHCFETVSHHQHQHHILLTDHDSDWLERNVALNREAIVMKRDTALSGVTMSVDRLDWKNPRDIEAMQARVRDYYCCSPFGGPTKGVLLVGSDILYNHASHRALAHTLYQLSQVAITAGTCRIILGFPDRNDDEAHFMPIAREFFGEDTIRPSQPIPTTTPKNNNNRQRKGKKSPSMDLRVIDFYVKHDSCTAQLDYRNILLT
eukprot:scaffold8579_cov153-Amphora_coffeaeformis.AAC.3